MNSSKPPFISLLERFGQAYLVEHELGGRRIHDPWEARIICRHGHIYPAGGSLLGVSTNYRGPIANRIRKLPFVSVVQDGDDGINAEFDVAHFPAIAQIIKPRSRRHLSDDHRRKLLAAGKPFQFRNGSGDAETAPGLLETTDLDANVESSGEHARDCWQDHEQKVFHFEDGDELRSKAGGNVAQ